jgi:hypothetical protein
VVITGSFYNLTFAFLCQLQVKLTDTPKIQITKLNLPVEAQGIENSSFCMVSEDLRVCYTEDHFFLLTKDD